MLSFIPNFISLKLQHQKAKVNFILTDIYMGICQGGSVARGVLPKHGAKRKNHDKQILRKDFLVFAFNS